MNKLLSIEFWIATQLFIDLVLVMLFWRFVRKMKRFEILQQNFIKRDDLTPLTDSIHQEILQRIDKLTHEIGEKAAVEMVDRAAQDIIDLLDPLVKGSEAAANTFEHQIKEKQRLIKGLNDALDSRIISINLLLSRADVILSSKDKSIYQNSSSNTKSVYNIRGNTSGFSDSNSTLRDNESEIRANPFYNRTHAFDNENLTDVSSGCNSNCGNQENSSSAHDNVADHQQKIVEWYQKGVDIDTIASKLSMPRGEVQLIISLKEKFIKMEKQL